MIPPQEDHADELDVSDHIDGRWIVPFDADLPVYSLGSVQGSVASCCLFKALAVGLSARRCERPGRRNGPGGVPHVLSPCAMGAVGIEPCLCSVLP